MSDTGLKGIGQVAGEQVKSAASQAPKQVKQDLSGLLENLLSQAGLNQADKGIEGVSSGGDDNNQTQTQNQPKDPLKNQADLARKQKEAELEARLKQIIARYQRIQEEIQAYRKRKKEEEKQEQALEEQEKKRKKEEEEAKKQQEVVLPSSPKRGFMAGFLKKLSGGGEQGRLKE